MLRAGVPANAVGVLFRFGRPRIVQGPASVWVIPRIDELVVIYSGSQALDIPGETVTRSDGRSIVVGACVHVHVTRPLDAATKVVDYRAAVGLVTRTALQKLFREGPVENEDVRALVDDAVAPWGVRVDDVALVHQAP